MKLIISFLITIPIVSLLLFFIFGILDESGVIQKQSRRANREMRYLFPTFLRIFIMLKLIFEELKKTKNKTLFHYLGIVGIGGSALIALFIVAVPIIIFTLAAVLKIVQVLI